MNEVNDSYDTSLQSGNQVHRQSKLHLPSPRNQQPISKLIIGQANPTQSALSPQSLGFHRYIFLCMFNILKQWHVLYFIVFVVVKSFYTCDFNMGAAISQIVLIIIYLGLEGVIRYKTYQSFAMNNKEQIRENTFQIWQKQDQKWVQTNYFELKPGQIIKIPCSLYNFNTNSPVNVLPLQLASKKKQQIIQQDNSNQKQHCLTKNNKQNQLRCYHPSQNCPMSPQYSLTINYIILVFNINTQLKTVKYLVVNQQIVKKFILPKGVPIIGEQFIIGVVLVNFNHLNQKSLQNALNAQNKINHRLKKSIIPNAIFFILLTLFIFFSQFTAIMVRPQYKNTLASQSQTYGCIFLNILAISSYFIYVALFIFLGFHRLRDRFILKQKNSIAIKNSIKSIDQFGQTDTIIMDDYFFIDKNLFQVENKIFNTQNQLKINQALLYKVLQKSQRIKQQMNDLWISIMRYYRIQTNIRNQLNNNFTISILKEKVTSQTTKNLTISLRIQIKYSDNHNQDRKQYVICFSQKPKLSTIDRIKNAQILQKTKAQTKKGKNKQMIYFNVQMRQLNNESLDGNNSAMKILSRNYQANLFEFLLLISFRVNSGNQFPLALIKNNEITKKHNIIILSKKKWKYLQIALKKNDILHEKIENITKIISLQQKDFQSVKYDIQFHLRTLKQSSNQAEKSAVLAIHCSLVSYLIRPQIARGLIRLARYSKYVIFHECSQFQKQRCCMNLFQIFPEHIFLSNYICDLHLIQKSNLSICQKGQSSQPYVTLIVTSYKDLRYLIVNQAIQSINITVFIIKSFLFKNHIFIINLILTQFLIYQGSYFILGIQFNSLIFFIYNLISSFPILYYILFRPQVWEEPYYQSFQEDNDNKKNFPIMSKYQYLSERNIITQFARASFIGVLITLVNYSFLMATSVENIFFSNLTSCIVASGLYQLFIDDARSKKIQVVLFFSLFVVFFFYIYALELWNNFGFRMMQIQINLTTKDSVYFFLSNLVIGPFILGFIFYGMSVLNVYIEPQHKFQSQTQLQNDDINEIVARVDQSHGKQIRFRSE